MESTVEKSVFEIIGSSLLPTPNTSILDRIIPRIIHGF